MKNNLSPRPDGCDKVRSVSTPSHVRSPGHLRSDGITAEPAWKTTSASLANTSRTRQQSTG